MEPKTFEEAVKIVANEIAELVIERQRKYGHDNINAFGEYGILVRVYDKHARIKNMIENDIKDTNEPKTDSWMDNGGYSILAVMLDRDWFKLPLKK